jgi:chromosome segregation ATPase
MEDYQVKLNDISQKVGTLVARYNELQGEYRILEDKAKQLEEQNKALRDELQAEQAKTSEAKQELKRVKLQKSVVPKNPAERVELKRKVNEFIKEIDRCVALLND